MSWPPTGRPSTRPMGTEIAGTPARLAGRREDVVQVHLVRIRLRTQLERRRRRGRREDDIDARIERQRGSLAVMQARTSCALLVVRVVVAGRQHVGAEQDAARDFRAEAARSRAPRTSRGRHRRRSPEARTARHRTAPGWTTLRRARRCSRPESRAPYAAARHLAHRGAARAQRVERAVAERRDARVERRREILASAGRR